MLAAGDDELHFGFALLALKPKDDVIQSLGLLNRMRYQVHIHEQDGPHANKKRGIHETTWTHAKTYYHAQLAKF